MEILELAELTPLQALIALDLLGKLAVERLERLSEPRHLLGRIALPLPLADMLGKALSLGIDSLDRLLILGFVSDHDVLLVAVIGRS
jgi:hypothetical protein